MSQNGKIDRIKVWQNNKKGVKIMPMRICDSCGKEKDVTGGKTCENGHFVCRGCIYGGFFGPNRTICPLCKKSLR